MLGLMGRLNDPQGCVLTVSVCLVVSVVFHSSNMMDEMRSRAYRASSLKLEMRGWEVRELMAVSSGRPL